MSKLAKSMKCVCKNLREDEDYYRSWQANIAMQFKDLIQYNIISDIPITVLSEKDIHKLANSAAKNFLNLLSGRLDIENIDDFFSKIK